MIPNTTYFNLLLSAMIDDDTAALARQVVEDAAQVDEQDTAHLAYMDELFSLDQCDHPCRDYFELGSCKCTGYKSVWVEENER